MVSHQVLARVITLAIPLFHGRRGGIERSRPVPAHVSAERLPRAEHHAAGVAPVDVAGGGALAGPRAEEELQAVGAHPRPVVAGPVAAQRLERRELPPARPALEPLPPSPATLVARRRRRACARCCCFLGGRAAGQGEEGRGGGVEARRPSVAVLLFFFFSAMNMEDEIVTGMLHVNCWKLSGLGCVMQQMNTCIYSRFYY